MSNAGENSQAKLSMSSPASGCEILDLTSSPLMEGHDGGTGRGFSTVLKRLHGKTVFHLVRAESPRRCSALEKSASVRATFSVLLISVRCCYPYAERDEEENELCFHSVEITETRPSEASNISESQKKTSFEIDTLTGIDTTAEIDTPFGTGNLPELEPVEIELVEKEPVEGESVGKGSVELETEGNLPFDHEPENGMEEEKDANEMEKENIAIEAETGTGEPTEQLETSGGTLLTEETERTKECIPIANPPFSQSESQRDALQPATISGTNWKNNNEETVEPPRSQPVSQHQNKQILYQLHYVLEIGRETRKQDVPEPVLGVNAAGHVTVAQLWSLRMPRRFQGCEQPALRPSSGLGITVLTTSHTAQPYSSTGCTQQGRRWSWRVFLLARHSCRGMEPPPAARVVLKDRFYRTSYDSGLVKLQREGRGHRACTSRAFSGNRVARNDENFSMTLRLSQSMLSRGCIIKEQGRAVTGLAVMFGEEPANMMGDILAAGAAIG
ncbi:hypothetical protein D9C73_000954 [Collichthys lucidus]|uniref:Uncharacterized protein n=1 Tax=Collichthys lucidus TaxID=240159 RepID=A0A4V6AN62_COLLU|nr:hypothetical protein D9C73_000954 [Collichthys lucidus]